MSSVLSRSSHPVVRTRSAAGLTLAKASEQAGCHLQAFFLQEQGAYPELLPAIRAWLVLHEVYLPDAVKEYREYQRQKRRSNGELRGLSILELGPPEGNPFVGLRQQLSLSRMGFAKAFCIHPGLLYRVELGISQHIPGQLRDALIEAGLPVRVIDELAYRLEEQ